MKNILDTISEIATGFAHSQGWRNFDHVIELDMTLPWNFRDQLQKEFLDRANILVTPNHLQNHIKEMLEDVTKPLHFKQMRLPNNIIINLLDDNDRFSICLTKKEPAVPQQLGLPFSTDDEGQGAKVLELFPKGEDTRPIEEVDPEYHRNLLRG